MENCLFEQASGDESAMRTQPQHKFKLVGADEYPASAKLVGHELERLFVGRQRAAAELRRLDDRIKELGRYLAKDRGVTFIRVEQLQQEFGGNA